MPESHRDANMAPEYPFDHHSADFVKNHRAVYRQMREDCPVAHSTAHGGFWVLSSHKLVSEVARDDLRFSSAISLLIPSGDVDRLIPLQVDPPDLQWYRLALMPFFTPDAVSAMCPAIRADAKAFVAKMAARGNGDVIQDFSLPVPSRATMRLLGLDPDDWEVFARPIKSVTFTHPSTPEYAQAEIEIRAFGRRIEEEVDARLANPGDDGIGLLIRYEHDGRRLGRRELIDMVRMLIFGGMDTVTGAVGNIVAILAQRPDLQRQLRDDPALLPTAIEEFLRYEAPIQGFARKVMCPVTLGQVDIPANDLLWINWGAANHDPAVFSNPEEINLHRHPNKHMTFGIGAHLCSGARLARAEIAIMISELLGATEWIELHGAGVVEPLTIGQLLGKAEVNIRLVAATESKHD